MVFQKGMNDWNHFTLLEFIYQSSRFNLSFPDLAHIVVVRPLADGATNKRIVVNLLNATNGVDCSRDMPLEFGDVVEIPEREHTLAETGMFLTKDQEMTILNYFRSQAGEAKLIVAGGQTVPIPLQAFYSQIGEVLLKGGTARSVLTSSSDLARVKVTRRDPKTNKTSEWILDCSDQQSSSGGLGVSPGLRLPPPAPVGWAINGNNSPPPPSFDLWLRAGDVIEVPEKP
jgi:hypothetical protein